MGFPLESRRWAAVMVVMCALWSAILVSGIVLCYMQGNGEWTIDMYLVEDGVGTVGPDSTISMMPSIFLVKMKCLAYF